MLVGCEDARTRRRRDERRRKTLRNRADYYVAELFYQTILREGVGFLERGILDGEQQAAAEALVAGEFPRMETFFVMREVIMRHAHHVIVNGRREQPPWP